MDVLKNLTLAEAFRRSAEIYSERPFLSWVDEEPITYGQGSERVNELKIFLKKKNILPGDRIAILGENSPNWGIAYLAITTLGAVAVPILPEFHQNEVIHILRHSGTKAIFVSRKFFDKVVEYKSEQLKNLILLDDFTIIPPQTTKERLIKIIEGGKKEFARIKLSALHLAGLKSATVMPNDLASIVYTSGTTGHSKGVMLTHQNLVSNALNTLKIQNVTEKDRLLSLLPLSHTYECTIGFIIPMLSGAVIYYLKKPPTASVMLPAMRKIKPTMILTVPLIMEKIFKSKIQPKLTNNLFTRALYKMPLFRKLLHLIAGKKLLRSFGRDLNFYGIGGALLAADVEKFLRDAKFPYAIGYGLTETSPLIAGSSSSLTRYRSAGYIIPGLEVKLINQDKKTGIGEIVVKGQSVMKGYYKDPEKTVSVFTKDGFFKTGDLGMIKKNYLYIKGRLKNVIVDPSGENIYPEEIEAAINEHDLVLESLVYKQQNKIIARIHLNYEVLDKEQQRHHLAESKMKEKIEQTLEDVRRDVNSRISSFSRISKVFEQIEPFEKTPTQKIKRYIYTS